MFKSHLRRIFFDYRKIVLLAILLLLPSMEVIQLIVQYSRLGYPNKYNMYFLSGCGRGHVFQVIYLWLMPIYLLLFMGDDAIIDSKLGYKNILVSKTGKKKYVLEKVLINFFVPFIIVIVALLINCIFVNILGGDRPWITEAEGVTDGLSSLYIHHPMIAYYGFALVTAFFCGLIGSIGAILSVFFQDRKFTYPATFFIWFFLIIKDGSIMLVFQPYAEYPLEVLLDIAVKALIMLGILLGGCLVYEVKTDTLK